MSERVLVVESNPSLCRGVAAVAQEWGTEVLQAHTAAEARRLLDCHPRLMLVDDRLPDGNGLDVTRYAMRQCPAPVVVVMSDRADPESAFRLARAGAMGFVAKPLRAVALRREVNRALEETPNLVTTAVAGMGKTSMRGLLRELRLAMVVQALAMSDGSRSGAGRLLSITRQAVQQIVRDQAIESPPPARQVRPPDPASAVA